MALLKRPTKNVPAGLSSTKNAPAGLSCESRPSGYDPFFTSWAAYLVAVDRDEANLDDYLIKSAREFVRAFGCEPPRQSPLAKAKRHPATHLGYVVYLRRKASNCPRELLNMQLLLHAGGTLGTNAKLSSIKRFVKLGQKLHQARAVPQKGALHKWANRSARYSAREHPDAPASIAQSTLAALPTKGRRAKPTGPQASRTKMSPRAFARVEDAGIALASEAALTWLFQGTVDAFNVCARVLGDGHFTQSGKFVGAGWGQATP